MTTPYYNYSKGYIGDRSDNYLGKKAEQLGEVLDIKDARNPNGNSVRFIAFVNSFSQNFTSNWNQQEALGRMDNIATFKNTTRDISVGWDIPAPDLSTARENLNRCNALISLLYPTYTDAGTQNGGSYIMSKPPLVRIKYSNLISNASKPGAGLLGYITSLTWTPVLEMGNFHDTSVGRIYPKVITISMEFTVLHETARNGAGPTGYFDGGGSASGLQANNSYGVNGDTPGGTAQGWPFGMGENTRTEPIAQVVEGVAADGRPIDPETGLYEDEEGPGAGSDSAVRDDIELV